VKTITKRNLALACALALIGAVLHYDMEPLYFWLLVPAFIASFFLFFHFNNQARKEAGLESGTPKIVRFLIRFVLCLFIALGAIMALCLLVYFLNRPK